MRAHTDVAPPRPPPPINRMRGHTPSIMQSGSGIKDHLADACIRAPGAAALALALGDPAASRGCFLLNLNLANQRRVGHRSWVFWHV